LLHVVTCKTNADVSVSAMPVCKLLCIPTHFQCLLPKALARINPNSKNIFALKMKMRLT
jgi:hypothetical protein